MKKLILFLLVSFTFSAYSTVNTEISCEMKRDEWDKMTFNFHFLTQKRAIATFQLSRAETSGRRNIPVSAIHVSGEARYVGINFLEEEKLVFILLTPIFETENAGTIYDIEVVSSIYGSTSLKCKALK